MSQFIGREAELSRLDAALADRATTPGLFLGGEVGVGKSRLIAHFADRAATSGATTATGGCLEFDAAALPFAPFVEALGRLYEGLDGNAGSAGRPVPPSSPPWSPSSARRRATPIACGCSRRFDPSSRTRPTRS